MTGDLATTNDDLKLEIEVDKKIVKKLKAEARKLKKKTGKTYTLPDVIQYALKEKFLKKNKKND